MVLSGRRRMGIWLTAVVFGCALLGYIIACQLLQPVTGKGLYRSSNGGDWQSFDMPLTFDSGSQEETVEARFRLGLSVIHPNVFQLTPDDCLQELTINGRQVADAGLPFCDYSKGRVMNLGAYLHPGINDITATVLNHGGTGQLSLSVASGDPLHSLLAAALILAFIAAVVIAGSLRGFTRWQWAFAGVLALGILLRFTYFLVTPYEVRGHDAGGHLEYIDYVATHFTVPAARAGWEFYHPPLYYYVTGLWERVGTTLGWTRAVIINDIQGIALGLSVLTLLAGAWIAWLLYPQRVQRMERLLFVAVLAVFPALVFMAPRVNNDVLLQLWMFLCFVFLLRWWKAKVPADWYLALGAVGLGILTKTSMLLFVPVVFLCLLGHRLPWKTIVTRAALGLCLLALMTGWFFGLRFLKERNSSLVQNLTNLNSALIVDHSLESLTEFNPVRFVRIPYNNPWDDASGRNNFWEYFLRSAFVGEFSFGPLAFLVQTTLLCAVLLLPCLAWGLWYALRNRWWKRFPVWVCFLILLAGHAAYRQKAPYSSSQDFRYSLFALVPAVCLILDGIRDAPRWLRMTVFSLLAALAALCAVFLGLLTVVPV